MTLASDIEDNPLPSRPRKLEPLAPPIGFDITKKVIKRSLKLKRYFPNKEYI